MSKREKTEATEKVEKAKKVKEKSSKAKSSKGNIFVRAGKVIKGFVKDFRGETKKIVWPGAKDVLKSTGVVLAVVIVVGACIFGVDRLLSWGVGEFLNFAENYEGAAKETANLFTSLF